MIELSRVKDLVLISRLGARPEKGATRRVVADASVSAMDGAIGLDHEYPDAG